MIDLSRTIENLIEVGRQLEVAANLLPDDFLCERDEKTDEPIREPTTNVEMDAAHEVRRLVDELLGVLYEDRVSLDIAALRNEQTAFVRQ